ncbi:MAG: sigma-70 family RNA polymerase sigma factor [Bacteroidota bacterium]
MAASGNNRAEIESIIIDLLKREDRDALPLIYANYKAVLFGNILRIVRRQEVAEDVFQETLLKIWKNRKDYDPQKGRLFTWMVSISRNTAIDKTRTREYKQLVNIQSAGDSVALEQSGPSYEMGIDQIGMADWVNKLDEKHREVIEIVYFQGYTHRDAAEKLGMPLGTLKSRVRNALIELRKFTDV